MRVTELEAVNETSGQQAQPPFVLTREDEDGVANRDVLASVHGLLTRKIPFPGSRIQNLRFDCICGIHG